MSDRYRPPTGPKGSKGTPSGPKGNWKNQNSNQYFNGPLPKRYKERDNYRPNLIDKPKLGPYGSNTPDRPSGPSYREGPGLKRPHPDDRYNGEGPNKKRDYKKDDQREWDSRGPRDRPQGTARDKDSRSSTDLRDTREYRGARDRDFRKDPRDFRDSRARNEPRPPSTRRDAVLDKAPKGPRSSGLPDGKQKDRKRNPPPPAPKPVTKLRPSQMYLLYTRRNAELYQRVQQVGEGTYGKVYKAKNDITGEFVALKKLRLESEREGFPITAMREIKLLQSFDHPNIVGLLEMMVEHNQIFMVFDYLDHDLTGLLTHPDLKLTEGHRKMIFKQLMEGLNYLHKRRVIHRDIKGSNILLNAQGILKIADFGLARNMKVLAQGESPDYTNRVITIWYRPPELLLGSTDYGREVDIWGVGCLLMELYTKTATFQGTEEVSQLFKIFEIMGTPTLESWPNIENLPWFEMLKPRINKKPTFEVEYKPLMTPDSFDLAQKLLELVPSRRLTAEQALEHHYFHNDPKPEALTFMATLEGEWHEFETKKRRREERKRLQGLKNAKGKEASVPPTQPKAPNPSDLPDTAPRSMAATPFDGSKSVTYGNENGEDGLADTVRPETGRSDKADDASPSITEAAGTEDKEVPGQVKEDKPKGVENTQEKKSGEAAEITTVKHTAAEPTVPPGPSTTNDVSSEPTAQEVKISSSEVKSQEADVSGQVREAETANELSVHESEPAPPSEVQGSGTTE